jgi:hypothetical protein
MVKLTFNPFKILALGYPKPTPQQTPRPWFRSKGITLRMLRPDEGETFKITLNDHPNRLIALFHLDDDLPEVTPEMMNFGCLRGDTEWERMCNIANIMYGIIKKAEEEHPEVFTDDLKEIQK